MDLLPVPGCPIKKVTIILRFKANKGVAKNLSNLNVTIRIGRGSEHKLSIEPESVDTEVKVGVK